MKAKVRVSIMTGAPPQTLFDELTDFLVLRPTEADIIAYQASEELNKRLHHLLDENSRDALSMEEQSELDSFLKLGHLITMLKAKARLKLTSEK